MKIRHVLLATVAYFISMIIAVFVMEAVERSRPSFSEMPTTFTFCVAGFYGITWWFVPPVAAALIRKIRHERIMGLRP